MIGAGQKTFLSGIICLLVVLLISPTSFADTYYVPDDFATIQAALNAAVAGDEIIVRDGAYTGAGNREIDFDGKAVTLRSENGPAGCIIDVEGSESANHHGFRFVRGETPASVLDGFTITGGYDGNGAGVYCHNGSPTITNCIISGNTATSRGGAIYCYYSNPVITNCVITGNTSADSGGGLFFWYQSPQVINCTITGNTAVTGGGIRCVSCSPTITNSILWNDSASEGAEIYITSSANLAVSYSDVEGGQAAAYVGAGCTLTWGDGNIDEDPLFAADDYHLTADSPCIDAGADAGVYGDIDAEARPQIIGFDMGADEYPELASIHLAVPEDGSTLSAPPTFTWTAYGGVSNVYAVDIAFSLSGPLYSTHETLHLLIDEPTWTMPAAIWNKIPPGKQVYWRVRGADMAIAPVSIITSDEVWSFTKQ